MESVMNKAVMLTALLVSGATALAQAPADAPASTKIGPNGDPKQIVCITQSEIGSRLSRRRVCRTRAEWAEHRAQYQQSIERAQNQTQTSYVDPPMD
jgi:hypothetical protein